MTAATKPQAIPVAEPRTPARRRDEAAPGWFPSPKATARAASTKPSVTIPASTHEEAAACSCPPDGDARRKNRAIPAHMAAAPSQSRGLIRTRRRPAKARNPNTSSSSSDKMGWTMASGPYRSAISWKPNPPIMLTMPRSHIGRRARLSISRASNPPVVCTLFAPWRCASDAVAVHKLAASASKTATCILSPEP